MIVCDGFASSTVTPPDVAQAAIDDARVRAHLTLPRCLTCSILTSHA